MSQYKYRDYRPGYGGTKTFLDQMWQRTNARNEAIYKTITDNRLAERRLREELGLPTGNGRGGGHAGGGSGGSLLFWMAAFALGAVALHFI
jgi:hypothetical protein